MEENTIDTTDRISTLPDSIAHHILSYLLDDPKSRVRMSVLSKGWYDLTTSFPILNFHLYGEGFYSMFRNYDYEYVIEKFCKHVQRTVSRFYNQNIGAHTLNISADIINIEQIELFGRCLDLVLEEGLQMMDIGFKYYPENLPMFRFPNTLLSASTLTSLTLHQCELPLSLMVCVVKFKSLRLLSLSHLPIDEGVIEFLTKASPILEEIYLRCCYGFKTICVKRHQNLLKVGIYCDKRLLLERIDVEAPNLSSFLLESNKYNDKTPSMFMGSCKKLTTFSCRGFPFKRFHDLLSSFPILENVSLNLVSLVDNLKLSHQVLRSLELKLDGKLEEIELNTPNLRLFEYSDRAYGATAPSLYRKHSSMSKGYMKCAARDSCGVLWYLKLRKFLEKNSIFKVLKLDIYRSYGGLEEFKLIQSPPYELEHVELIHYSFDVSGLLVQLAAVDAILWCCRPRSLTLDLCYYKDTRHIVKHTYDRLLRQENEDQTNIKFVLFTASDEKQHFSDLNSLLKRQLFLMTQKANDI